jgi:hypothetical protein
VVDKAGARMRQADLRVSQASVPGLPGGYDVLTVKFRGAEPCSTACQLECKE